MKSATEWAKDCYQTVVVESGQVFHPFRVESTRTRDGLAALRFFGPRSEGELATLIARAQEDARGELLEIIVSLKRELAEKEKAA